MDLDVIAIGSHPYFFPKGDTMAGSIATANVARTSNVATITTAAAHGLYVGAIVTIAGVVTAGFNASSQTIVAVPSATTFTYANVATNVATTAETAGTVSMSGTCSKTQRPMNPDRDVGWISLGACEKGEDSTKEEEEVLRKPSPGRLAINRIVETSSDRSLKFTCNEVGAYAMERMKRTGRLTSASTQYNPGTTTKRIEGWLQIERYNGETDARVDTELLWVSLKIDGSVNFDGKASRVTWMADELTNRLNTGTL